MSLENDFLIISKDRGKLDRLYNHLTITELPKGVCIYNNEIEDYADLATLAGLLRHTDFEELEIEIDKAKATLGSDDYLFGKYENNDSIYLRVDNNMVEIANDWLPKVTFIGEGLKLPENVRYIVNKVFGLHVN